MNGCVPQLRRRWARELPPLRKATMAYTRCTDCGAKALLIATRCPSCGSDFPRRDASGDRIRHRRCRGCDIHVPRNLSTCPWCTTEARDLPWRAAAAAGVALVLLVGGGFFLLGGEDPAGEAGTPPVTTSGPSADGAPGIPSLRPHAPGSFGEVPPDGQTPAPTEMDRGDAWSPAEAVTFVNVRAAPTREAQVLGVVPEAASVLLGDLRGGWRRIRVGNLSGWVDGRLFRLASSGG